ncbi:MAG: ATP-binding cassette domain-containing protein [Candidatus Hydrogenedentes bacterium]|nr:ATP-binding cassette domain-containing protein [Candidatus Hydrogenedentota bacterium]
MYPQRRGSSRLLGRGGLHEWLGRRRPARVPVLQEINLTVRRGETLGIIGRNGSGKSTLLKLMAGVTLPTSGAVTVRGRIASLLELGAGFHPMLSGRENIYLNAGLLGMRHESVDRVLEPIIEFSGLREFIDQPVETYSSGMYVRLGFSVAVHANPEVFLVDEVLAVGDEEFQRKCRRKIGELKEQGKTIVFVSHDLGSVHALCDRVVLLQQGRMLDRGSAQATIDFYLRQIGSASAIHLLGQGDMEVIFSHGRLSLFHRQRELTSARGLSFLAVSLGNYHSSGEADWELTEKTETSVLARGRLPRLPITWNCRIALTGGALQMDLALEVERACAVQHIALALHAPTEYAHWYLGDRMGTFPPISPEDTEPTLLAPPAPGVREVCIAAPQDAPPPLQLTREAGHPHVAFQLQNGDYAGSARIVYAGLNLPESESRLAPGRFEFGRFQLAVAPGRASVDERFEVQRARRRIVSGAYTATFDGGSIAIFKGELPITADVHWHTELRAGDLWLMSHAVRWGEVTREGDTLMVAGASVRIPGTHEWRLRPVENGFQLEVILELTASLTLQEYNVSVALTNAYAQWATPRESGPFPPISPESQEWVHLSDQYPEAAYIAASGPGLPQVRLAPDPEGECFRMSALNTAYSQQARVIQALRTPGRSLVFPLPAGRHELFRGTVTVKDEG